MKRIWLPFNCEGCGEQENGTWFDAHMEALRDTGLCFSCHFWHEKWLKRQSPHSLRVGGCAYWIGVEPATPGWGCGFGGSKFVIVFNDGRRVTSRNVWCNGDIPPRYAAVLPDNARWEVQAGYPRGEIDGIDF